MRRFSVPLPYLAAVGAVGVGVLAAALYFFDRPSTEALPATAPPTQVASKPSADASEFDALPAEASSDRAFHLVAQARRLAESARFAEANAKLDEADKLVPGLSETAEARRRVAELSTPDGRFALQIARARNAVGNDDYADAAKSLDEAERLKPQAPEIAELRRAMQAAQQKESRRRSKVAELLATMRDAIARNDVAGADRAFNEASRVDVLDPALEQARVELAQAHDAAGDKDQ